MQNSVVELLAQKGYFCDRATPAVEPLVYFPCPDDIPSEGAIDLLIRCQKAHSHPPRKLFSKFGWPQQPFLQIERMRQKYRSAGSDSGADSYPTFSGQVPSGRFYMNRSAALVLCQLTPARAACKLSPCNSRKSFSGLRCCLSQGSSNT